MDQQAHLNKLADEVTTLKRYIVGLSAVIAALPQTAQVDNEKVRAFVDEIADPAADVPVEGTQVAQAMFLAQRVQDLARNLPPSARRHL